MKNIKLLKKSGLALLTVSAITACSSQVEWIEVYHPSDANIKALLDSPSPKQNLWSLNEANGDAFTMPEAVRPCCAFGHDLKVNFGSIPIPFVSVSNSVGINDIGNHSYGAGYLTKGKNIETGDESRENNGIIYTVDGGFLDLAHIRDTADNSVAIFYRAHSHIGSSYEFELDPEIGRRLITLSDYDLSHLDSQQLWSLSAGLASYLGFQLAKAHEIGQYHGLMSVAMWPEQVSAYSLEDLFSNMLGAKIASQLIENNLTISSYSYNQNATTWIYETINYLKPLTAIETTQAMDAVDGIWWDSTKKLPDESLVLKRNYNLSDHQYSLTLNSKEVASLPSELQKKFVDQKPISIALTDEMYGIKFSDLATFTLYVNEEYRASFAHIPEALWINGIDSKDFQTIALYDRKEFDPRLGVDPTLNDLPTQ